MAVSPTMRRRRLGLELRRLREAKKIKLEDVAAQIDVSMSVLSRIERGRALAKTAYVTSMLDMYGVTDSDKRQFLVDMAREGQRQGWWAVYDDVLPTGFETYVGLEGDASRLRAFETIFVHGLLQTEDYARSLLREMRRKDSAEHIQRLIDLRMQRQQALTRKEDPLDLWVILDEAVIRRPIGGTKVMCAQLAHLVDASQWPNVTLQVLPFTRGAHAGLDGPFYIITFSDDDPDVGYVEGPAGNIYLEKRRDVTRCAEVFDHLRAAALAPDESIDLINTAATEIA